MFLLLVQTWITVFKFTDYLAFYLTLLLRREELQQFPLDLSSLISRVDVWTSTSSLLHISLASSTRLSRMFWPSLLLVSMKIALYSRAIFSPSSAPTHLLPSACWPTRWSTLFPHRMMGILFSDTSWTHNKY